METLVVIFARWPLPVLPWHQRRKWKLWFPFSLETTPEVVLYVGYLIRSRFRPVVRSLVIQ